MQQGGFTSSYYQFPNSSSTNPNSAPFDHQLPPPPPASAPGPGYASAPPFAAAAAAAAAAYSPADYSSFSHNYPPFSQNPDPAPPPPTNSNPNSQYAAPPPYYPPYDQNPTAVNYSPYGNSYSSSNPSSSVYPVTPFGNVSSSVGSYENPYESVRVPKFDSNPGYFDDNLSRLGGYGRSGSDLGSDLYGKRPENSQYDYGFCKDDGYGDGVYAYKGKTEPYGARGTDSKSTWSGMFDDYGRAISFPSDKNKESSLKVVKAVPKAEANTDVKSGVLKFRVKLLPESGGQSVMDVLCTVGLDGIRMLDPSTSRTLRIYPLETVTRCEKYDSSTFAFWSKTSVDIEPRRIRLQSSSYTTNTILDTVTAATVQFKEMGGRIRPPESSKVLELPSEKKKGFTDWINRLKPVNEEKDHWIPDEAASKCTACGSDFGAFLRRHHCRNCGDIFCDKCTQGRIALTADADAQPVRVCDRCMAEVTLRLNKAKEAASKPVSLQSHEDLARKLQEEMEKNLKISSGGKADGSGRRMREVACPTCTVHLQVQVPASGSETIECGVCQHPFLVSSH